MSTVTTTVNVGGDCGSATPGTFTVQVEYGTAGTPQTFGPFATRESAERCVHVLAGRSDVRNATIQES